MSDWRQIWISPNTLEVTIAKQAPNRGAKDWLRAAPYAMTREEATALLNETCGRPCGRVWFYNDGRGHGALCAAIEFILRRQGRLR